MYVLCFLCDHHTRFVSDSAWYPSNMHHGIIPITYTSYPTNFLIIVSQ